MVQSKDDILTVQSSEIKQWLTHTISERNMSAQKWCDMAGVSPTTVTEFISGKRDFLPSITTLTKLSMAVGHRIIIKDDSTEKINLSQIKLYGSSLNKKGIREMTTQSNLKLVDSNINPAEQFGIVIETNIGEDMGIYKGDTVLCVADCEMVPQGSIVVVLTDLGTSPYVYVGNKLRSDSDTLKIQDAHIVGYGLQLIRNLPS